MSSCSCDSRYKPYPKVVPLNDESLQSFLMRRLEERQRIGYRRYGLLGLPKPTLSEVLFYMNIEEFKPSEISVKVIDGEVVVHGKRLDDDKKHEIDAVLNDEEVSNETDGAQPEQLNEANESEHLHDGKICTEFTRYFKFPNEYDPDTLEISYNDKRLLTVSATKFDKNEQITDVTLKLAQNSLE